MDKIGKLIFIKKTFLLVLVLILVYTFILDLFSYKEIYGSGSSFKKFPCFIQEESRFLDEFTLGVIFFPKSTNFSLSQINKIFILEKIIQIVLIFIIYFGLLQCHNLIKKDIYKKAFTIAGVAYFLYILWFLIIIPIASCLVLGELM